MTTGERIVYGTLLGLTWYGTGLAKEVVHSIQAQETITVKSIPIELPEDVRLRGWTYFVDNDCLHEHPEDTEEYCRQMEKAVLRRGATLGSVVLDTGEIIMVKGERGDFTFIDEALAAQAELDNS